MLLARDSFSIIVSFILSRPSWLCCKTFLALSNKSSILSNLSTCYLSSGNAGVSFGGDYDSSLFSDFISSMLISFDISFLTLLEDSSFDRSS